MGHRKSKTENETTDEGKKDLDDHFTRAPAMEEAQTIDLKDSSVCPKDKRTRTVQELYTSEVTYVTNLRNMQQVCSLTPSTSAPAHRSHFSGIH